MEHYFWKNLPQDIMIDIFLRLPIGSIMRCKCVCKSWRDLFKTREFAESHSSRSVPSCLALFQRTRISRGYKIIEYLDTKNSGENHCNMVLNFTFPYQTILHGSANGLLFLLNKIQKMPFICNPITREYLYVKVPHPKQNSIFGFGVSKLTGEYKVVRLFYESFDYKFNKRDTTPRKCEVYSLRTGLWRSVATADDQLRCALHMSSPTSLNGNLHWLVGVVSEDQEFQRILCFDLETECFSTFSIPHRYVKSMCALGDSLCLCDNFVNYGFEIWLMNKYGDDKSWRKEFDIKIQGPYKLRGVVVPIKFFKDGDILFVHQSNSDVLYCYSSKTRTIREIDDAQSLFMVWYQTGFIYTPTFIPLKTLTRENNVISL